VPVAITVCDVHANIIAMNPAAHRRYSRQGGLALIGTSLLNCHPEHAQRRILNLLADDATNSSIVEAGGKATLLHQATWHDQGAVAGLIEFCIPLPADLLRYARVTESERK